MSGIPGAFGLGPIPVVLAECVVPQLASEGLSELVGPRVGHGRAGGDTSGARKCAWIGILEHAYSQGCPCKEQSFKVIGWEAHLGVTDGGVYGFTIPRFFIGVLGFTLAS